MKNGYEELFELARRAVKALETIAEKRLEEEPSNPTDSRNNSSTSK
jgi:hypothetical protein